MRSAVPLASLILAAAAVMTASAHVRIEGKRQTVAIVVAAHGISVTVEPAKLDCERQAALAGCPKPARPRPA